MAVIVDNTPLFRARAKMLQAREAAAHIEKDVSEDGGVSKDTSDLSPRTKPFSFSPKYLSYSSEAVEIRRNITALRDIVISRRKDYIAAVGHYRELALTTGMSEWERNQMDAEVDQAMRQSVRLIRSFQHQIFEDTSLRASDEAPHFHEVGHMLDKYLKKIAKIVAELRAVRVMKTQNMKKMSRLSNLVQMSENLKRKSSVSKVNSLTSQNDSLLNTSETISKMTVEDSAVLRRRIFSKPESRTCTEERKIDVSDMNTDSGDRFPSRVHSGSGDKTDTTDAAIEVIHDMDRELEQQLIIENEDLYSKLIHADDDIQNVERQMNEILKLQETLAEKVVEQDKDVDIVHKAAVDTVENIRDGNEQIREAIQNMASRRVILLFCLIALTFSLLFLDWYNP